MALIECITKEAFAPFGSVIEIPQGGEDGFYIVEAEEEAPWRQAVCRYNNRSDTPQEFHVFILDKPICLKKGVWHQVLSLTDEAQVKITENLEVTAEFYDLQEPVGVGTCVIG